MITLYLVEKGLLNKPVLYLSDYFEKNKGQYYDYLTRVRTHNDLMSWVKFFLRGVIETSESSSRALRDILELKKELEEKRIYTLGKKVPGAKKLLDYLFYHLVADASDVAIVTGLSSVSSYKMIEDFLRLGILREMTGNKRNRIFIFEEYAALFRG
jgi:Fic family protein